MQTPWRLKAGFRSNSRAEPKQQLSRPCLSLWYHHQAFRDDTRTYSTPWPPQMQGTMQSCAMRAFS